MAEEPATPIPTIPPLAHEVMGQLVVGFRKAVENAAARLRRSGWTGSEVLAPEVVLERARIEEFLHPLAAALLEAGANEDATWNDLDLLSVHVFYALSHELQRRKRSGSTSRCRSCWRTRVSTCGGKD